MEELLLVRRSVYDAKVKVVGYELKFQDCQNASEQEYSLPASLSTEYLSHVFAEEEMQTVLGTGLVIVDFSSAMLQEEFAAGIPKDKLVISLSEEFVDVSQQVIEGAIKLAAEGYKIAIKGVGFEASLDKLGDACHYARISVDKLDEDQINTRLQALRQHDLKIIAEDIQTHESFDMCKKSGFDFFEGYFLNLPNLVNSQKVATNRVTTMRLLMSLERTEINLDEIEEVLSQDARLSYKMLRVVNSAALGLSRTINSLREAIIYLGLNQIRSWANLIVLSSTENKPSDLMITTMIRARMAESMAEYIGVEDAKPYFTVGLFSTLDAMLDQDMTSLLEEINLAETLKEALISKEGELGCMLQNVIAYEQGDWGELLDSGVEMEKWRSVYLESVAWATESMKEIARES